MRLSWMQVRRTKRYNPQLFKFSEKQHAVGEESVDGIPVKEHEIVLLLVVFK